jgi:hypothetical protein
MDPATAWKQLRQIVLQQPPTQFQMPQKNINVVAFKKKLSKTINL